MNSLDDDLGDPGRFGCQSLDFVKCLVIEAHFGFITLSARESAAGNDLCYLNLSQAVALDLGREMRCHELSCFTQTSEHFQVKGHLSDDLPVSLDCHEVFGDGWRDLKLGLEHGDIVSHPCQLKRHY